VPRQNSSDGNDRLGAISKMGDGYQCNLIFVFLRDNWLSNRVFKPHNDIVDHCCDAWKKLIDQPWKIMLIGRREWAHRL